MDVYKGGRGGLAHVDACGQGGEGAINVIFCGRHKWMAPYVAVRAGFEPVTLWTKGNESTNEPPCSSSCDKASIDGTEQL